MTDDEINAILIPEIARHLGCEDGDLMVIQSERIAYRTGMLRAAQIARELGLAFVEPICEIAAFRVADAIERAASEKDNS